MKALSCLRLYSFVLFAWLAAAALPAQICDSEVSIGNFDVVAGDPVYDGSETEFEYCVTGVDGDDFHALSHWSLSLCAPSDFFVSCDTGGEGVCGLDTDPHTGIEGVKFDDIEVEKGETQCFTFSLTGDWTGNVGEVALGIKAAQDVELGLICGPICDGCVGELDVTAAAGAIPSVVTVLRHQIPAEISTPLWYRVFDDVGDVVHSWKEEAVQFEEGTVYTFVGPMPGLAAPLEPGRYKLTLGLRGMSGFAFKSQQFIVPAE